MSHDFKSLPSSFRTEFTHLLMAHCLLCSPFVHRSSETILRQQKHFTLAPDATTWRGSGPDGRITPIREFSRDLPQMDGCGFGKAKTRYLNATLHNTQVAPSRVETSKRPNPPQKNSNWSQNSDSQVEGPPAPAATISNFLLWDFCTTFDAAWRTPGRG